MVKKVVHFDLVLFHFIVCLIMKEWLLAAVGWIAWKFFFG
jgi:hypothetical protein